MPAIACPLCVLGIPQEGHTPQAWVDFAENPAWQAIFAAYCKENEIDLAAEAIIAEASSG